MNNYIDGFILPIRKEYLNEYKKVVEGVAEIWKEYGALAYFEYVGEDLFLEGTRSFSDAIELRDDEVVVFGWVVFPTKDIRDLANEKVPSDNRMTKLVTPLVDPKRLIFDASQDGLWRISATCSIGIGIPLSNIDSNSFIKK